MMKKWIVRILWVIGVCYFIFFLFMLFIYYKSRSPLEGKLTLKGLEGKVTLRRDDKGIPHITAEKSDQDAFFALGYVHAQDRFWQMEFNRRVAQGTLSELFGERTVDADKYLRTWGFYKAAEAAWPALSPSTQHIIQSYTDGINAYISQKHFPLQITLLNYHPKPWTVIDSIAWQKVLAWDLQNVWKDKVKNYLVKKQLGADQIAALFSPYPKDAPVVLSDEDLKQSGLWDSHAKDTESFTTALDQGSNAWVVSGNHTVTGKPLLANDPHLELQAPSLWYLAELRGPHLHVIGATMPGVPGVVIGHNDAIAWGVTNVNPDAQDLYILPSTENVHVTQEIIKVRNKPDVVFPVLNSPVGPVISGVTEAGQVDRYVALKWTAFLPGDTTVQSILKIDYAQNWQEFVNALKDFVVPAQNFIYADTQGNIGYYLAGKIPVRDWPSDLPMVEDSQHQWKSDIPFEQLPHVFNPKAGMIVSANNKITSGHYPYAIHFRWGVPPYRATRIYNLLKEARAHQKVDIEQFKAIQQDTVSLLWQSLSADLLQVKPLDQQSRIALEYLNAWEGNADRESIAQTIFAYWYRELGDLLTPSFLASLMKWPEPLYIQSQLKTHPDFLSESLQKAMRKLIQDRGHQPEKWKWGEVHKAVFRELGLGGIFGIGSFWNREIASPGSLYTVNAGTYDMSNFEQTNGAGYRQIIDLSHFDHSVFVLSLGQSNDVFSTHYQDMMTLWREGKYLPMNSHKDSPKSQLLVLLPE